jgi:hypothetical protein
MYSPARHAMAYRHAPGSRAHAEPHRSARTPAGFFDWFAVRHHDAPLRPQSGLRATGSTSRSSSEFLHPTCAPGSTQLLQPVCVAYRVLFRS